MVSLNEDENFLFEFVFKTFTGHKIYTNLLIKKFKPNLDPSEMQSESEFGRSEFSIKEKEQFGEQFV
jgi:hypothetical protein